MATQLKPGLAGERHVTVATYATEEEAVMALRALHAAGLRNEQITIVSGDFLAARRLALNEGAHEYGQEATADVLAYRAERKGRPEVIWGLVGGVVFTLADLAAMALPAFGGSMAHGFGPVFTHVSSVGVAGLFMGALVGALIDEHKTEDHRLFYREELAAGHWVVMVDGDDATVRHAASVLGDTNSGRLEMFS